MKNRIKNLFRLTVLIAGLGLIQPIMAQTFTTLHDFTDSDGSHTQAGLVISDNTLYGVTDWGSTVFALNINGTNFTPLIYLPNSDGNSPDGTLVISGDGSTLYGTAYYGGTYGDGTLFAMNTNGTIADVYSFSATSGANSTNSDGANPEVGLVSSGNTWYGTTEHGGTNGCGTVFVISANGFTNLHNFTGGTNGAVAGGLLLSGNTLYGVASGSSAGNGVVFKVNTNGTGYLTLYSFTGVATPSVSPGGLVLSGNTLYGTGVGSSGRFMVFAVNTDGTGFTNLYTFTATSGSASTNSDGALPIGRMILLGNTLYGTAYSGGIYGNGTVFSLNTNGTGFTNLYNFSAWSTNSQGVYTNSDGANPYAGLALSGNTLFGTTKYGGTSGDGTVFSIYLGAVGLAVTTTSLPNGTNGVPYNQTLTATGGKTPYTWTNISGALPPGLSLSTNGVISGTPTVAGISNLTVMVTDTASNTATQPLTLTVGMPPNVTLQPTNSSITVIVGNNAAFTVSVSGTGPFTYQWQLNGTNLPNGIITTVAGNGYTNQLGTGGFSGDGGAATNAELNQPCGVAMDSTGNLFIADQLNNVIREVKINGIITTVAGNYFTNQFGFGTGGFSGDGGAATNAELNQPCGVAVDSTGNLFIADQGNNRVREVGTNGIITTVAGGKTSSLSGLGDGGEATNAELAFDDDTAPDSVTVDAIGNLFIGCNDPYYPNYDRVRKVGTNGIITTVAGGGNNFPGDGGAATNVDYLEVESVAVDAAGNLFIADQGTSCIRKVDTNGIITTVAGGGNNFPGDGGAATNAEFGNNIGGVVKALGVAVDTNGNLFIADCNGNRIREVKTNGIITTVAGNGYVAGNGDGAYSGDGGAATNAELNLPINVSLDSAGNLFIADSANQRIRKVVFQGQSPTLILNNVGVGNAGTYDVVVSGPYGSVTSSVVNVSIVVSAPVFQPAKFANGQFLLTWSAVSNGVYQLQYKTNLTQANWVNIGSTITASNTVLSVTNSINTDNQRFYRVQQQ